MKIFHKIALVCIPLVFFILLPNCSSDGTGIYSILSISQVSGSTTEGGPLVFKVNITSALYADIDVTYQVTGTGNFPADADDFSSGYPEGTVTIPAGRVEAQFSLPTANDLVLEQTEHVAVSLVVPTASLIAGTLTAITGTIEDDMSNQNDVDVTVSSKALNVVEGNEMEFTFALSEAVGFDVTIDYSVSGTVDGDDFGGTLPSGSLTISAGDTSATVGITPEVDGADDGETMTMNIDSVSDLVALGTPSSADVTVND